MKIKTQISLSSFIIIFIAVVACACVAVVSITIRSNQSIEEYRVEEIAKTRHKLEDLVNTAYAVADTLYTNSRDRQYLENHYGLRLRTIIDLAFSVLTDYADQAAGGKISLIQAKRKAFYVLRNMRFDDGKGYIWINDTTLPYPSMVMHPTIPALNNTVLDDPRFNCSLSSDGNLFKEFVDICSKNGSGFSYYRWPKPTAQGLVPDVPKLSYVRLFREWDIIIGTGIYIDDAIADAEHMSIDAISSMRYDDNVGYFWINDTTLPYPKMIMHPTLPKLNGTTLDAREYDCALGIKQNLFQAAVEVCNKEGSGFIEYLWPKPTKDGLTEPMAKLSYVKMHKGLGWVIGTGVYLDTIEQAIQQKTDSLVNQLQYLVINIVIILFFIMLAAITVSFISADTITKRLHLLIDAMNRISKEGFSNTRVDLDGAEEIDKLGNIFNNMMDSLGEAVKKLQETTAAKERIESELVIARQIQMDILPKIIPPYPDCPEFKLFASIEPAKEVGGDFYDFFFIDENRFFFTIGDVSGKGVPASLFMAITITLMRMSSANDIPPHEVLTKVNAELARDNDSCMFVTIFCGIMDARTGEVQFANAGHNPPYVLKADGTVEAVAPSGNMVVAAFEESGYNLLNIKLSPGDVLFLYTDGVTEALNPEDELFSEARLERCLAHNKGNGVESITKSVNQEIKGFTQGIVQSDDITMLAIKYMGKA